ncbi:hypothetical protein N0V90_004974 [Kalmusia sp. IMI 367209]|nr:hypothetical protein N0V90_004974 [Kalmusia sp. IMI 367209]
MSKQLFVVFGATGNQGGSAAHAVLDDAELSKRYSVRAITRDTSNPKAQALGQKGAEVVSADLDDPASLPAALQGAAFVFALTNTSYKGDTREVETRQAKALVDEAVKQGAQYIIWSSMSHPFKISGGKLKQAQHFDVKAEIEAYIRGQPVKSAFYAPGSFMQNYYTNQTPRPSPANDGTYVLGNLFNPDTKLPLIDITDSGAWIGAILADPDKYDGKFFAAAQGLYTVEEVVQTMSKVSGKTVTHYKVADDVFKGYLPELSRDMLFEMYVLCRDYGYFGEGMEKDVEWARAQARGRLTTLEEFFRKTGFKLE